MRKRTYILMLLIIFSSVLFGYIIEENALELYGDDTLLGRFRIALGQAPEGDTPMGGQIGIHGGGNTHDWT